VQWLFVTGRVLLYFLPSNKALLDALSGKVDKNEIF
jgi:hypothetical protein